MGAKNYSRVKETYKKAVSIAIGISVLAFICFNAFRDKLPGFSEAEMNYMEMNCTLSLQRNI